MWELIRQNRRKSFVLFVLMGCCLIVLGYLIGAAYAPPDGGIIGIIIATAIWMLLSVISYFAGDSVMLSVSGAREITRDVHPQLFNVVEEMKIAAQLPAMPKVYIINEAAPNAFATGRKPERSSIAVTAGLLSRLNRDELQGVVAHETSHILNRDILFMTFAGVMLGSMVIISQVFLRSMFFSGGSMGRYSSGGSRRNNQGQGVMIIVALIFAILAPILARLLYFAISRRREYLADASGARLTRYPEGLASALEKISSSTEDMPRVSKATAGLYIVNPLKEKGRRLADLTSTHPPISERIKILRSMAAGAGFNNYQEAYSRVKGKNSPVVPASQLKDTTPISIRAAGEKMEPDTRSKKRDIGDLVRAVNKYMFLTCICGLKIKIPPDFKKPSFNCPRCQRELKIPTAELAAIAAIGAGVAGDAGKSASAASAMPGQIVYQRKKTGWESFSCICGNMIQLSPSFSGDHIGCPACGREILIRNTP